MYTRMGKQKLGGTLIDYSSGSGATFGIDKNMVTTAESLHHLQDEHVSQSKSQPSSHKKKKAIGKFNQYDPHGAKGTVKKLQYSLVEDQDKFEQDMNLVAHLNTLHADSKDNTTHHPSIIKYTNNPYKATSTLSFYNKLSDTKAIGNVYFSKYLERIVVIIKE